jgi:methionyl-tRNA formyltransferase
MKATEVYNLYRSIYTFKHLQTSFNNEPVKIIDIGKPQHVVDESRNCNGPGHLTFCKKSKQLFVECGDGKLIEIKQLTIGKKKAMTAKDFDNGFLKKCSQDDKCFR